MGIGSAVVGTVGLAAGWHTITYAILNAFPPMAIFALAMTAVTGVVTKDKTVQNRIKEIDEAINQY